MLEGAILALLSIASVSGNYLKDDDYLIHHGSHYGGDTPSQFTGDWIVKLNHEEADEIAKSTGFQYKQPVHHFPDYHIFTRSDHDGLHETESVHHTNQLTSHDNIEWAQQLYKRSLYKRVLKSRYETLFNDDLWKYQWYEQDYRANNTTTILDMNLVPVYEEFNITGKGVRIAIIDDGIEYNHDDIKDNFDHEISFNFNRNTTDVTPRYEDETNNHGTRCAGEIAAVANNSKCSVGVAFSAKVGGITLLDGPTDDLMESSAIMYAHHLVDIYSGSWGPQDNGQSLDGPGILGMKALKQGITTGRGGKGSIYVFASGNGGFFKDHCSADGYVSSIYSIAISSATKNRTPPMYSEKCTAVIATAFSGSIYDNIKIVTTDIHNECTADHSGTSAAAPLAAGVIALVLEANNELTWRDVQHLLIHTSEMAPLTQQSKVEWSKNARGYAFSPYFGFGLINAYEIVKKAKAWTNVPRKFICSVPIVVRKGEFDEETPFLAKQDTYGCGIRYLEHVQLNVTLSYKIRGNLEITIISPSGTKSKLIEVRPYDKNTEGFKAWKFLSLQFWGESPRGKWTVEIRDKIGCRDCSGKVDHLEMILHGTTKMPKHYNERRKYILPK